MSKRRKIAVITGTRADYGLLRPTIQLILADPTLELLLLVTGSHLSAEHGMTVNEIESDGVPIAARLPILEPTTPGAEAVQNSRVTMARSLGKAVLAFTESFDALKPEIVLIFGDRYEMLAAAESALLLGIPIVHFAGGERSEGAVDEAIRHSITKMAVLHLVTTDPYRRRVIQLGEAPETVITVGAPVLDSVAKFAFASKSEICANFAIDKAAQIILLTLHSETLTGAEAGAMAREVASALDSFTDIAVVITAANADAGGEEINEVFRSYANASGGRVQFHESLGHERYLSLLKISSVVLGNSSSGVIEAPILGVPSINLGARQQGRLRSATVLDCACNKTAIEAAIATSLSAEFRAQVAAAHHPFGEGSPSEKVVAAIRSLPLQVPIKRFYDC